MVQRSYFPTIDQLLETDRFVLLYDNQIVVRDNEFLWDSSELHAIFSIGAEFFVLDELFEAGVATTFIAVLARENPAEILRAENRSLRSLLFEYDESALNLAGKASQILDWYNTHKYCGACGAPTIQHETQRAVNCSACGRQYFPRINPCAIMLVVNGDQILLARSARFKTDFFSCLAGFIEVGETPEQTVVREVREEVGLEVHNVRYIKSQSWPFPSQLMLGFIAEYKTGKIVVEPEEIEEAHWYNVSSLPKVPSPAISVAGELIQHYVKEQSILE
jgi:NAD+ diphosphatase